MSVTAQDWRVTALQELSRSREHLHRAESADDSDPAGVLRDCWAAYEAAGAGVGSYAQSLVAAGRSWAEIAGALGLPESEVAERLEPLVASGWRRLQERLPRATADTRTPLPTPDRGAPPASTSVLVLSGPNLNLLGTREPAIYGSDTLGDVERLCSVTAAGLGLTVDFRQANGEGQLIDAVHEARTSRGGIVINPAAYTHTSIALMDALSACSLPVVEVHLSNIHQREEFRHLSYVSKVASAVITGCGTQGYALALHRIAALMRQPAT